MISGLSGVGKCSDNISESRKRLIDLFAFLKTFPGGACHPHTLATSQINKVELANSYLFVNCLFRGIIHLLDDHNENGMRSRRDIVHLGGGSGSRLSTALHESIDLIRCADSPLGESFNEDTAFSVLSDLEARSAVTSL